MTCQCCGQERAKLVVHESTLVRGNKLMLCNDCKRLNHEPRHLVVIAASSGLDIRLFIKSSRYCGKNIEAQEVM
jgi:protein-arginine kinase activator protein McsA